MTEPARHLRTSKRPRCPHCGEPAIVRTSRELSPIFREQTMQCTNPSCSFSYVVGMEVLRSLSPSGVPNPDVTIPESHHPMAGARRASEA